MPTGPANAFSMTRFFLPGTFQISISTAELEESDSAYIHLQSDLGDLFVLFL